MKLISVFCLLLTVQGLRAQVTCTAPGQNPWSAFPVCGTSTFSQSSVPICGGQQVPSPTCRTFPLQDVNPFWYKFTCFQSGTLGFRITPNTNSEDYDWQVFDITGRDPNEVYTNVSLVISCNWSGEGGATGASSTGTQTYVCEGLGKPLWSSMPELIQGHEYILLVSHFTQTQSGYSLSFGGGTAVITDSTQPRIKYAEAGCGGAIVRVKLNKKMKCSSIAADGSDFFITPATPAIVSASGIGCSTGFDTDSIELHLASSPAPGAYVLHVKNGSDNNTVLDYCDNALATTEQAGFTVLPLSPTPMDSLSPVTCKPNSLVLVFPKPILCSSVAADGSDFTINGTYPVSITEAHATCSGGPTSKELIITLDRTLYNAGHFTLTLKTGSDGNTLLDECTLETPAGSSLGFDVKDTVNADFTYIKKYGCLKDTINFLHPGGNGVNSWHWQLDDNQTSTLQAPQGLYTVFSTKHIALAVSNGVCADSSEQTIPLDNFVKADFMVYDDICPNEPVSFTSTAQGIALHHSWVFGDGGASALPDPTHSFATPFTTRPYTVTYTVTDSIGCMATKQKLVNVYSSCYLDVPSAFTPNNDGLNDLFGPLNAIKAEQLDFRIYNRWGQLLFQTHNWKSGWDGTYHNLPQPTGTYVWFLSYVDRDSKQRREMKGTAVLIR